VNDLSLVNLANIALCCWGCNASKGRKTLEAWLQSDYCRFDRKQGLVGPLLTYPPAIQIGDASPLPTEPLRAQAQGA